MTRWALIPLFLILLSPDLPRNDEECLACHDAVSLERSAHGSLDCGDCHSGLDPEQVPHADPIEPVDCFICHSEAPESHPFHPHITKSSAAEGAPGTVCVSCHGSHDILKIEDPASRFRGPVMAAACGECHSDVAERFTASEHGRSLASGVPGAPDCISCHTQPITEARNGRAVELKIAQESICLACHLDDPDVRARMVPGAGFIAAYDRSVHGKALRAGNAGAATCVDCHGSHEMSHGADPAARISKMHIPGTCAQCHAAVAEQYDRSIHAMAVRKGQKDAPVCTDCHGEHDILRHTDPRSPVAAGNVSARVCSPCHSSVALTDKYGIASDRFQTFSDSYHGLAIRGGSIAAANCASCHGAHDIRPSSDPGSSVNAANLKATCGQCHPGANERFAEGDVHVALSQQEEPVLYWIATAYITLIIVVVGGMFLHNLGDFVRKTVRRLRIRSGEVAVEPTAHARYLRMSLNERLQHAALGISFILLVITGFMLRYPEFWWVIWIRGLSDRVFDLRGILHRIAGVIMIGASLWHAGYLLGTRRGRRLLGDLIPGARDVVDGMLGFAHNLGLTSRKPRFGRFGYIEKSEYWALVWGTIVMAVTGIIMWFEDPAIRILGKLGWDIGRTIHFYEAWLAALAIFVWHIYYVVFNPDVYPMSTAFLTGTITESEMAHEHPLELAEIRKEREAAARQEEERKRASTRI